MADASSKRASATNTLHSNTFWLDCLLSSPSEGLFVEIIESIMFLTQINSELRLVSAHALERANGPLNNYGGFGCFFRWKGST